MSFEEFCVKYKADHDGADPLTCALSYLLSVAHTLGREYDVVASDFFSGRHGHAEVFDFIRVRERFNASMLRHGFTPVSPSDL